MAPEITVLKELRFKVPGSRETLRVRQGTPNSAGDFVSTGPATPTDANSRKDMGVVSSNSAARVGASPFYVASNVVHSFPVGSNLFVNNSSGKTVTIVELEN